MRSLRRIQLTSDDVRIWVACLADQFGVLEMELDELDRSVGDGDHGSALKRGFQAAAEKLAEFKNDELPKAVFMTAGSEFVKGAGGASGLLFSVLFKELGRACSESARLQAPAFSKGLTACVERITKLGKAEIGDKTMLDALQPASLAAAEKVSDGLAASIGAAAAAAEIGALATIEMVAKQGRGRYVAEGGRGHMDPGAKSVAYIFQSLEEQVVLES